MTKKILIVLLLVNYTIGAQVGINTTSPNAMLEIKSSNEVTPLNSDGLLIPKINEFPLIDPTADQDGMLVYVTGIGSISKGFYYWENSSTSWKSFVLKIDDLSDAIYKYTGDGTSSTNSSLYLGVNSGILSNDATSNVGIGHSTLSNNTSGTSNIAIGNLALESSTIAVNNIAVGQSTLKDNISGSSNVAIGNQSLQNLTTGGVNIGIGANALNSLTTGGNNIALGALAHLFLNTGSNNVAIGPTQAGGLIERGTNNISIGSFTHYFNSNFGLDTSSFSDNIAIGRNSGVIGGDNIRNTTIGFASGQLLSGHQNVVIGPFAAGQGNNVLGDSNVFIGAGSGAHHTMFNTTRNNSVFIGENAGIQETNSNRLYINSKELVGVNYSDHEDPLIGGDFVLGRVGIKRVIDDITNAFEVNGEASKSTAGSWLANSDRRLKKDIEQISGTEALNKILQLRGVSYNWNDTVTNTTRPTTIQYGFIAQELIEVFPDKVTKDRLGYYQTSYGDYDAFFVEAIKELKRKNDSLIEELKTLRIEQNEQNENMKILKNEIDKMKKSLKE